MSKEFTEQFYCVPADLHAVHHRAVLLLGPPLPEPHLRGRGRRVEIVHVVDGVWVRVVAGADAQLAALLAVGADVLAQRRRLLEGAVAEGAAAGSLPGVDELVVLEVLQATQALPADGAHVRLLARVRAPVLAQAVQMAEAIPALGAGVRLLARVDPQVSFQRPRLAEAAPADPARVGLLPSVDADVLFQAGDEAEGLSAFQAVVRAISRRLARRRVGRRRSRRVLRPARGHAVASSPPGSPRQEFLPVEFSLL